MDLVQSRAEHVHIRLLGPMTITRDGRTVTLPASRKVRALIAYLALASGPVGRTRLCELLWDVPSDPRGELRWCLSKIRSVLDDGDRHRIATRGDLIELDLSDCFVDTLQITRVIQAGVDTAAASTLRELRSLFAGEFLDGIESDRNPHFAGWLVAQRQRYRAAHIAVLEQLVALTAQGADEMFVLLERWLQLAPFDMRAHEALLNALVQRGRLPDAESHLAATIRVFDAEGLDWLPLREKWRRARARESGTHVRALTQPVTTDTMPTPTAVSECIETDAPARHRASLAVMPFVDLTPTTAGSGSIADGLTEDIITRLAKLRVLFVIARGTVYALRDRNVGAQDAGRLLNVDYVVGGCVRRRDGRLTVTAELAETRAARIIWADEFEDTLGGAFAVLESIGNRIVAAIAEEIETAERNRAVLRPPSSLDAWEAYHRGLWHMYRFKTADNNQAERFFRMAVDMDPTFSRAYAGLSFTHFQNAFLLRTTEREQQIARAFESAGQSVIADDRDPAAHWAMGRALWLRGRLDDSLRELARSVELSPNFALGHYTYGFVHCQSGDPQTAIRATDYSRHLSPFDPLQFAMLATRALAHARLGEYEESVDWALKAAARPNAHTHILAIAANCLAAAGRLEEACDFTGRIRRQAPGYDIEEFLGAFRFAPDAADLFRRNAAGVGLV